MHRFVRIVPLCAPRIIAAAVAGITFPAGAAQPALAPDLSGAWAHPYVPGFEPPVSGPGPVTNRSRIPGGPLKGVSNPTQMIGDYTNPILKPDAAAVVKTRGEEALRGIASPTPLNQCFPDGIPFDFAAPKVQLLQQPDKITILIFDVQFRQVRLNQPHPARVVPSWFGDSVGHYEGDTLVIDTIGIKTGPLAMVDMFGTPHSEALHVIERYRLIDEPAAQEAQRRAAKENFLIPPGQISAELNTNYHGKHLQLEFTVEDPGVFTTPWSATVTYGPPQDAGFYEYVCAENPHVYYSGRDTAVPTATKPDF